MKTISNFSERKPQIGSLVRIIRDPNRGSPRYAGWKGMVGVIIGGGGGSWAIRYTEFPNNKWGTYPDRFVVIDGPKSI